MGREQRGGAAEIGRLVSVTEVRRKVANATHCKTTFLFTLHRFPACASCKPKLRLLLQRKRRR